MASVQNQNSHQSSQGSSVSSGFSGIDNAEALAVLKQYIETLASGGTADYKAQRQQRQNILGDTMALQQDYSGEAAIYDAAALMADQVQTTYEKSMPAIVKAIQGAGTSSSSMQGLMASKLATDTAREAAALGAQQKTAYGQISASLANTLNNLSAVDTTTETNLIKALDLLKVSRQASSSQQTSSGSSSGSGSSDSGSRGYSGSGGYPGGRISGGVGGADSHIRDILNTGGGRGNSGGTIIDDDPSSDWYIHKIPTTDYDSESSNDSDYSDSNSGESTDDGTYYPEDDNYWDDGTDWTNWGDSSGGVDGTEDEIIYDNWSNNGNDYGSGAYAADFGYYAE